MSYEIRQSNAEAETWAIFLNGQQVSEDFGFRYQAEEALAKLQAGGIYLVQYTLPSFILLCEPGRVDLLNNRKEVLATWHTEQPIEFAKALERLWIAMNFNDYYIIIK